MKRVAFIFGLVIAVVVVASGQARTVTNQTLEKYQQKRLAAERQLRENYARLGFPSPEELDRQREADLNARIELARQLRQARLEKERLELERHELNLEAARLYREMQANDSVDEYGVYIGGFSGFSTGFGRFDRRRGRRFRSFGHLGGYRATPVGVIPTPPPPRPQRLFIRPGRSGRRH